MNNGLCISPKLFALRAFFLLLILSLIQLFHLTVIAELDIDNITACFFIFFIGCFYLLLLYFRINESVSWPTFNRKLFTLLFIASFTATLLFSRLPYVLSFLDNGLYYSRIDSAVGGGGWYSYISILFYPLCIIIAFLSIPRKRYYLFFALMMIIILIDFIALGTRGSPFFVLLFHLLMMRVKFLSFTSLILLVCLLILLVFLIDYQTQGRSSDTFTVGWDWVNTIQYSWIFDNLKVENTTIAFVEEKSPVLFPLIYLSQYITHSVAEFRTLFFGLSYDLVGNALYLQDQICLIIGCDRTVIQDSIALMNPRAGLYQTLYSSLIFDFGFLGFISLAIVLLLYFSIAKVNSSFLALAVYLAIIFAVSGVENYLYNGLGLARFIVFILIWKVISMRFVIKSIPGITCVKSKAYLADRTKASG